MSSALAGSVALAGLAAPATAQRQGGLDVGPAVAAIRKDYMAVKQRMAASDAQAKKGEPAPGLVLTEMVVNRNGAPWRAVGVYRVVIRFWHEEDRRARQTQPRRLRFVTVTAAISAGKYAQEYLFDARGRLTFHFHHAAAPGARPDLRVYVNRGRILRVIEGSQAPGKTKGQATDLPRGATLARAREAVRKGRAYRAAFVRLFALPPD